MKAAPPMSASDFRPSASWDVLRLRARMLRTIREFFDVRGFLEVETPILSADIVVDRHLEPLEATVLGGRMFLQTSPEFAMKRMMAATDEPDAPSAIYQITRAFRADERGRGTIPSSRSSSGIAATMVWPKGCSCSRILPRQCSDAGQPIA